MMDMPQGMMSPQQQAPTTSGMGSAGQQQEQQPKQFNGTVMVDGQPTEVVDGVIVMDGEEYYVAPDGSFVIDSERNIGGYIKNGQFIEADDAYVESLMAKGVIEQ